MMQTTIDFGNTLAPIPSRTKSQQTQLTLSDPPEYRFWDISRPNPCGRDLENYVASIASIRVDPIPFETYIAGRLSESHRQWFEMLLSIRVQSNERFPVDFEQLWVTLVTRKK